jgi:hypothetical protein
MLMALRFVHFKAFSDDDELGRGEFRWIDSLGSIFFKLTEYRIRRWTFNVRCSTFISFFFDQTGHFGIAASAAIGWAEP